MQEQKRFRTEPWRYTMTAQESRSWHEGDRSQRQALLRTMAVRVQGEAVDHHCSRYLIFDVDGGIVAEGNIQPNIADELEVYRRQIRLN